MTRRTYLLGHSEQSRDEQPIRALRVTSTMLWLPSFSLPITLATHVDGHGSGLDDRLEHFCAVAASSKGTGGFGMLIVWAVAGLSMLMLAFVLQTSAKSEPKPRIARSAGCDLCWVACSDQSIP